jgi:hypothetical protein
VVGELSPIGLASVNAENLRVNVSIGIALMLMFAVLLLVAQTEQDQGQNGFQAVDCQEDEDWVAVRYGTPNATEDMHGVTRRCQAVDG